MKSKCLLQVVWVLSSLVLAKAYDAGDGAGLSCIRWSPAAGQTSISFVRKERTGARSLLLTQWSEDARLITCHVYSDPSVTESHVNLCEDLDTVGQVGLRKFDLSSLQAIDGPCVPVSHRAPQEGDAKIGPRSRRKRAWTFPGTLWCGSGSKAGGYDQLGMFESADRCCREHDHCLHIIPAFTVNYGVFNPNLYTVSHCECDQRFRECLLGVNDSISSMVGYSFFNVLQVPCFELKQQRRCTEMYWFGMCKVAEVAPYAVFKSPRPFNTSDIASKIPDADHSNFTRDKERLVTGRPTIEPGRKLGNGKVGCGSRERPRGDSFHHKRTKGRGCKRRQKLSKTSPSPMPPAPTIPTASEVTKSDLLNASKGGSSKRRTGRNKSIRRMSKTSSTEPPSTQFVTQQSKSLRRPTTAFISPAKSGNKRRKAPTHGQGTSSRELTALEERNSLAMFSDAGISATLFTTKWPSDHEKNSTLNSIVMERSAGSDAAQSTHTVRRHHQKNALPNKTDHKRWCESLKLLDECKFKIPPREKKYDLQNLESKMAYHCNCTKSLALEMERFKQPIIVSGLLADFVSQYCFTLPKEKKCHHRKSCSGGFNKASDLQQAFKKIEETDPTGVQNLNKGRKRGIPVRLYKRCLRLKKEADLMAENR